MTEPHQISRSHILLSPVFLLGRPTLWSYGTCYLAIQPSKLAPLVKCEHVRSIRVAQPYGQAELRKQPRSPLTSTLGLSMLSAFRSPLVAIARGAFQPLAVLQSPYHQRRLLRSYPCRTQNALPRESVFVSAPVLSQGITAVSHWLAPEGAKPVECYRHHRALAKDKEPSALGSWPVGSRGSSVRGRTSVASFSSVASLGAASAGWEASSPRTVLAPTRQSTRTLRDEAAHRR